MKKTTVLSVFGIIMASCQVVTFEDDSTAVNPPTGEKTMHFKLNTYSMDSMDEIPDDDDGTRNAQGVLTRAAIQNATDHIILGIYDAQNKLVDTLICQNKSDNNLPNYGTITHTLKYGKYSILALGWNGDQKCIVHRHDSISFSEDWVPHTFLCRQNIVVSESFSDTRSLSLRRCVAKFTIKFDDKFIPEDLSYFVTRFSGGGCTLNSETKYCAEIQEVTRKLPLTMEPSKLKELSSYCFLPSDGANIVVNVTAYDANDSILANRTFEKVPMKINYITTYTGNFFNYGNVEGNVDFDITYDGDIKDVF